MSHFPFVLYETAQEMMILSVLHPLLWLALDYLLIANRGMEWTILAIWKPLCSFEVSSRTLLRQWPSSSCLRIDDLFNLSFSVESLCKLQPSGPPSALWAAALRSWAANSSSWESSLLECGLYVEGRSRQAVSFSVWKWSWRLESKYYLILSWLQSCALDSRLSCCFSSALATKKALWIWQKWCSSSAANLKLLGFLRRRFNMSQFVAKSEISWWY